MCDPKLPEHEPGADGDELEELFTQDREAWRGDLHLEDQSWRRDSADESWRGEAHLADWPEHAAGPEYWMFKAKAEGA
jgi:hypothetical protein